MKYFCSIVSVLVFGVVVIAGCGSPKSGVHKTSEFSDEFRDAPAWVLDMESSGNDISAVGSAKIGKAGVGFARTEALSQARSELARIIGTQVRDMVKNFSQQIAVDDVQVVDRLASQTSEQVSRQSLAGSRQKAFWISPSSTLYTLVAIDPEMVKSYVRESIRAGIAGEKVLRQQYQGDKSFEELDRQIENQFGN